ncbi:conjugal transfer protein TraI [Parapedobacter sp. ISTM3]|uniref:conjugal transfer protein TraI n=1 Tax=Parapedobacter sp. ISTM3 TaxID=2800130 RepID=UPI00190321F6|nr:conjugal transfer protein TraI [Parapedobacter sp. ISTM3]MBK1439801.1 conjugal transfer protein TraI [Parapedobacter sp. ISTM3]
MKQYIRTLLMAMLVTLMVAIPDKPANAGIYEIIKAAVVKVIKAVDLQIQRLQNRTIWLQNAQKQLENTMSRLKLREISDWTGKQRDQYEGYFNELWRVKNAIATYRAVRDIVERQLMLVEEYRRAWGLLQHDRNFTPRELEYMYNVYSGILEESLKNLDRLQLVAGSFRLQMSDGERLELIGEAGTQMENALGDLRRFNNRNFRISVSRSAGATEAQRLRKLYGLD